MRIRMMALLLLLLLLLTIAAALCRSIPIVNGRAKNVILFLGDAAGIGVLNAAGIHAGKPQGLYIQQMPHIGLMDTSSASSWVTDSAAGMTAIVTGRKTHNGVVSQSDAAVRGKQDGEPLKTILEFAEERGLATGVITDGGPAGATPAACYAHVNDRNMAAEIFAQVLKPRFGDGVDVLIGAGRRQTLEATRRLGIDAETELRQKGYEVVDSLATISAGARRAVVLLDHGDFDLGAATARAVDILSRNSKGFFLMVEADLHTNQLARALERAITFDKIIERTATRLKGNTLIVFAADHSFDTRVRGGKKGEPLLPPPGTTAVPAKPNVRVDNGHTGEEVVVAAEGPGAERVRGFFPNTQLFHIMMSAYGWEKTP